MPLVYEILYIKAYERAVGLWNFVVNLKAYERVVGLRNFVVKGSGILFPLRIIKADRYGHIISSVYFGGSYIFGSVHACYVDENITVQFSD
jgi:hypothetical protein